jgi:ribosomal protein S18 acetylase RimI-like enzyme
MTRQRPAVWIAAPSDAEAISELLYEFNGEALSPEDLAQRMTEVRGLETVFLGELDGSLAGLLVLRTAPTLSAADDWAEITEMYVRPASRRRGVGTALVQAALVYACEQDCTQAHLLVDPENRTALSFYESAGFRRDSWEMRLHLPPVS